MARRMEPVSSFEDGEKRPQAKECGQPLAAAKDRKANSPLEPAEKNAAVSTTGL